MPVANRTSDLLTIVIGTYNRMDIYKPIVEHYGNMAIVDQVLLVGCVLREKNDVVYDA